MIRARFVGGPLDGRYMVVQSIPVLVPVADRTWLVKEVDHVVDPTDIGFTVVTYDTVPDHSYYGQGRPTRDPNGTYVLKPR